MQLTHKERTERTVMTLEMSLKAAVYRPNDDSLMAQIAEKMHLILILFVVL